MSEENEYDDISRDLLKRKLSELHNKAHYAYALMAGLPKKNFVIFRDYNGSTNKDKNRRANTFTVKEFLDKFDAMHPDDTFKLTFKVHLDAVDAERAEIFADTFSLYCVRDLNLKAVDNALDNFLECYCEQCLRANRPFSLTPKTVRHYGFTEEDVRTLGPRLDGYNNAIKARLLKEYRELQGLDFIRAEETKKSDAT